MRRKEQQLRRKLRDRATIGTESEKICGPASVVAPTSVLVDRPRRRASTNLAWARPYVPGTQESGVVLPLDVTRCKLECPLGERFVWVARYTGPEQARFPKELERPTRSRKFCAAKRTEHQAFQVTLCWLWRKHAIASAHELPVAAHVTDDARAEPQSHVAVTQKQKHHKVIVEDSPVLEAWTPLQTLSTRQLRASAVYI